MAAILAHAGTKVAGVQIPRDLSDVVKLVVTSPRHSYTSEYSPPDAP